MRKLSDMDIILLKQSGVIFCSVCGVKPAKWVMGKGSFVTQSGYCSKTCIANRTIRHYKMEKIE